MLYALIAWDKPGALDLRLQNRPDHLAYLKDSGVVRQAGPFLGTDEKPCGSLIILEVDDMAAAEAWADADPYAKAGLFETVRIAPWNRVLEA